MRDELIWAILPSAIPGALDGVRRLLAAADAGQAGVFAGPADDAERAGLPIRVVGTVAVIPMMGPMFRRVGYYGRLMGLCGTDMVRAAVAMAEADPDIETILLHLDSPGGSVSGLAELGDTLQRAQTSVVAQVSGMAASAAYYVAAHADRIVVGPGDLVGSIGTRTMLYDYSQMFEQDGIRAIAVDTGEFKSAGAPGLPITDAQVADFQRVVDFYYDDFVARAASGRGMSEEDVRSAGDGRMFTPPEALSMGLIDAVATLEDTMAGLKPRRERSTAAARARLRI